MSTNGVSETGFGNRDQDYTKSMKWVVTTGGKTVTIEVNGPTNFGRKHLLLKSRDATRSKGLDQSYGWGIQSALYHVVGWDTAVDTYAKDKMAHRVDHRNRKDWSAAGGTKENRWAEKYRGKPAQVVTKNTVINCVTTSQRSIDSKEAAVKFATALDAAGLGVGAKAPVDVDFGKECVHTVDFDVAKSKVTGTTYAKGVKVLAKKTGADSYEIIHLEA